MKVSKTNPDLYHVMGKLEGQIDSLHADHQEIKIIIDRMHRRVMTIERHHAFLRGSVAALLTVGALLGAFVDHVVRWVMGR